MNYPNDSYYWRGFRAGILTGMEYQRRFAIASRQFAEATGAGVHIAMRRGNVPLDEVEPTTDQDRVDELHRLVWSSIITLPA